MDLRLTGKAALVTGASAGIGLAVCTALLDEGAQVLGASRTPPSVPGVVHVAVDMTSAGGGARAVQAALDAFGRLDLVVNNVGGSDLGTGFLGDSDETWERSLQLNLMSTVRTARAALPHLVRARGVMVNVSSVNGQLPDAAVGPYSASKAAMDNLTVAVGREYARQGVRVVGVAPGPVETPLWLGPDGMAAQAAAAAGCTPDDVVAQVRGQVPLGRFVRPEEVADLIVFLASERASAITATTVTIDGGLTPTV